MIALPEDMLTDLVQVADARPAQRVEAAPAPAALDELQALLAKASKPLVIAGGGGWNDQAVADLKRFVQAQTCRWRRHSAARTCSTTPTRITPATSAWQPGRYWSMR